MSPPDGENPFDEFDEAPIPAAGGSSQAPQTIVQGGRPMSSVGALPQPTEGDQQAAARGARESAGRTPRQRAQPQENGSAPSNPVAADANPYDAFDKDPKDDGVALMERLRLNRQDAFYRGSVAGSARLAALASIYQTPDGLEVPPERKAVNQQMRDEYLKVVADLAAHEEMQPFGTTMEAMAALGGQLEGTMISPEAWIGWGAKGATWLGRTIRSGVQQAGIQVATDPVVQGLNIKTGVQDEYDPTRTILSGVLGFGIGGGGHLAGEGLGKIVGQLQLRKQLFDLGKEDPSFDASRHAIWALDPNNGIEAPKTLRAEAQASPAAERGAEKPTAAQEVPPARAEAETTTEGPEAPLSSADAARVEEERLSKRYGAAQPKLKRLKEESRFNVFENEVGPILRQVIDEHGLDPEAVRLGDIWKHYDRAADEKPTDALESAINKWVSAEERAAIQGIRDSELERELDEWAKAYDAEADRMHSGELTSKPDFRGRQVTTPGAARDYRPHHLPEEEDIPFEHPRPNAAEGGNLPAGRAAESRQGEGPTGGSAGAATSGERPSRERGGRDHEAAKLDRELEFFGYSAEQLRRMSPDQKLNSSAWMRINAKEEIWRAADRYDSHARAEKTQAQAEFDTDLAAGRIELPEGETPNLVESVASADPAKIRAAAEETVEWAGGDKAVAIQAIQDEIDAGRRFGSHGEDGHLIENEAIIAEIHELEREAAAEGVRGGRTQGDLLAREIPEDGDRQAIAQRRKGGTLAGEPVRAAVANPLPSPEKDIAIRSLQQQAIDLAEALDFPLREGRVGSRNAAGTFNRRSGVVRVREVPDFDVVSHEAGHAIESKIGADMTALTNRNSVELKPLDYDPTKQRVNEGFAEFIRLMMTNPAYATRAAPTFALEFRNFMAAREPAMLTKLDQAAVAYKAYLDAPSVDAVGSVRRTVEENPHGLAKVMAAIREDGLPAVIKSVMQKSYDGVLDHRAPIARVVRELGRAIREREGKPVDLLPSMDPEKLSRLADRSRQSATRDLMDGVRPWHGDTAEQPALANAVTEAAGDPSVWGRWNPEKKEQLSTYTIARRAEYLWHKFDAGEIPNPPVAFSRQDAIQAMTDLEALNPNLRNASDMVHDYTRNLLRKSYDGGLIDADLYQKLLLEEFYVPFNRDMSDKPGSSGGSGGAEGPGTTSIVQKLRGSSRDIIDPIESIMAQTYLVNRTLAHNDIIKAFVDLAKRAGPEGGKYVEVIPAHEAKKYTADLEQAISNRAKEIGMNPADAQNIISALGGPPGSRIEGDYFMMERAAARGEPIVFYREGGQLKAARFMSEPEGHGLYELLTAAPEPVRDLWGDIVAAASAVKRSSIVTNPTFAITNYIRDQVSASILRSDYIPFYSGLRGIKEEFMQGNNAVLYGYAGGVAGGASVGPVEKAFKTEIDAMAKKGYAVNRLTSFKGLMELSSFTEAGTRNSIFGTVFEASKRKGLSDYDAMVEAAFQAQDLLDFSRHGSRTIAIRTYLPFLNAHLQGLDKARRTMIEPITNRIRDGKIFEKDTPEFNNAIAGWMKAGAMGGALGAGWAALNWENEAYRDANPYFKGTHLVVPFGNKIITVPKPFELGMGFTAGEYAYHALAQNDPRSARMFAEAVWDTISPPNPISDMPIVTPAIELALGKSMFTGRDIVPEEIQKKPAVQQYTDRTSELAKWLGQQTGLSPIKIDYAIGSQFATWGRDVMALSQGVSENSPAASLDDMIFFRRFVKDPTRSSDVTTRFWDFMSRTTGKFNQDVAGYNDLVREAVTRGQPISTATEFLAKLPAAEKAFVTLKSAANDAGKPAFTADERRLHPLQHAYDAVQILNTFRTELSENRQMTFGTREKMQLDPKERRLLLDNVRELSQMFMRNNLVVMGEGGFAGRPMLDVNDTMDKIRSLSPTVADEIATRMATAKVFKPETIQKSWTKLRDELVRNGSAADIRSLAFDAKAEGYVFDGQRAKRPSIIRKPIEGAP